MNRKHDKFWGKRATKGLGAGLDPKGNLLKNLYIDYIHKKYIKNIINDDIKNYKTILDFGCGNGRFSFFFGNYFDNVLGLDLSKSMIDNAQKYKKQNKIQNVYFIENDILKENFHNNTFGNIFTSWCLQHIIDEVLLEKIIKQFHNILDDNGYVIILEQTKNKYTKEYIGINHYKDLRTKQYYINLFEAKGFKLVKYITIKERTYGIISRISSKLPNFLIKCIPIFFIFDKIISKLDNSKNKQIDLLIIFKKCK